MVVYTDKPISGQKYKGCGTEQLTEFHVWSVGPIQIGCWHYEVAEDVGENLITLGVAKLLTKPFECEDTHGRERLPPEL